MPKGKGGDTDEGSPHSQATTGTSTGIEQREGRKLNEISKKLSLILSAIETLTETIKENHKSDQPTDTTQVSPHLTEMTQVLSKLNDNISSKQEQETAAITRNTTLLSEDEASKTKSLISKKWEYKLQKRKEAYWNMVKNKGHKETYQRWIESETIIVPKYLQRKKFNNEHSDQMSVRANAALSEFRTEIELQELRMQQHESRYKQIDEEMEQLFKQKNSGQVKTILLEMWKEETKYNERISERRWEKNQRWLKQYETTFKAQYQNENPFFTNDENKQKPSYAQATSNTQPRNEDRRNKQTPTNTDSTRNQYNNYGGRDRRTNERFQQRDNRRRPQTTRTENIRVDLDSDEEGFLEGSESTETLT